MKELQQAVAVAFENVVASGVIEKTIEAKLTDTINSLISDQLRSYSEFGKQLEGAVKAALQVDFKGLGLPGYNDLILKVVRTQVDAHVNNVLATQVEGQLAKLLEPAPAEIKLSELIKKFIESNRSDDCSCDDPEYISLHIGEVKYRTRWIAMDKDSDVSEYRCGVRFGVGLEDGHIYGLKLDDKEINKTFFVGSLYGFERALFQMSVSGTKVIVDGDSSDDFDTNYREDD